jgi:hypothetical protein
MDAVGTHPACLLSPPGLAERTSLPDRPRVPPLNEQPCRGQSTQIEEVLRMLGSEPAVTFDNGMPSVLKSLYVRVPYSF